MEDFHGMKRKDLQALCKKHGIPANLKNIEMATRLASVFEKETEETSTDTISLSEDSVDVDVLKDDLVVKKVRFSPENEVFEFTRSVKRCQRKNVRTRSKGINVQDLQESGIDLKLSTRIVAKGKTVAGSNEIDSNTRRGRRYDVSKALKVPRRSKRIGSSGGSQEDCKGTDLMVLEQFEFEDISEGLSGSDQDGFKLEKIGRRSTRLTSKAGTLLPARRSKRLVDIKDKEVELVKNSEKEVLQDDLKFEKVPKRSRRFVNDIDVHTNTQDQRRSIRLQARAVNSSMGGETSDGRPLCSAKESKGEIKTKESKRSMVVNSQEGELVKNKTKEPLIDCEVQTTEDYRRMKVQDASKVEKVPRRSKRLGNDNNVLMDKRPVKAVKRDDLEVEKAPKQSRQREKSLGELLLDGQASKGNKQPKRTFGNDCEDKKLLRGSNHTALDNMQGQAMNNSLKRCSVIGCERDGASVDNVEKLNVRLTRNSSRHNLFEAPIVVEGNLVEKKTDETLDSFVKSSKRVARRMKRDRSLDPGMDIETVSTQSNLTSKKILDEYTQCEQEEACDANVEVRGSSKKANTMNQECFKDKPQGMIENSPSSSETKAAESVMIIENVLDSLPEKSVDSSQRTNTQELNLELMEGKREEKLEQDTVLMAATEEDKKEVSSCSVLVSERLSPSSVQFAVSNPKTELVVPTGHILLKDIASTVIAEESTKTKEEILICTPISELKEHSSVEAILENSAECWKEIHPSKDEKGSLEKEVPGANLHGNIYEYNTENNSAEEEMEITKIGCVSVGHCVNLAPKKLLDEYTQLEPDEAGSGNVEAVCSFKKMKTVDQEFVRNKPQGMTEEASPSTSETNATEHLMVSENVLDSTLKVSGDISLVRNTQELDSQLLEGQHEEKHEQDRVLMAAMKEKIEASSLSVFLIERSEVSNPDVKLFVENTPQPASVQLAVSNLEAELGVLTPQILVKDIASTVMAKENIKTKEEILISISRSELKEHSVVAKFAEAEAILENSAECWNEIHSSKDDQKDFLEKKTQAENLHGNFSEYTTMNKKVCCISADHCVNLEPVDEVKDDSQEKSEQTISCEKSCKLDASVSRCSSTDFTSISPKENNVSKCFEEDEIKALSQPLPRNKDASTFDDSAIFTTPERNLMLMEQLSGNGNTLAADSVIHNNDEAVESDAVVFTSPKHATTAFGIYEAGKEEEHTATDFPSESDVLNTTDKLGGSRQTEARNAGESIVVELHDESDIATSPERQFSLGDSKGDRIRKNEENRTVELHCEPGTCTSLDELTLLGNYVSDDAENSEGNKAMELYEESVVFTGLERHERFGSFGQDNARKSEGKKAVQFYEESGVSAGLHRDQSLADSELNEAGWQEINSRDNSGLFTSLERQLLYGDSEQKRSVKTGEKAAAEFHDKSAVSNIPERHPFPEDSELDEAATSEENKVVELQVDCDIVTTAEKHLLLETNEGVKGDNITAKSHVVSDALAAAEPQSLMGNSEPDEAEKTYREIKDVELLGESNSSTNPERHILFGNSELDETRDYSAATCEDAFVFTSPERQILINSEPYSDGKQEQKEVDDNVVQESHVAAPDFGENSIVDSSGTIASKVSYNHELNAGQETAGAELVPKGSQAEDAIGLDATKGTSKKSRENSPHIDSVNLVDFDIEEVETITEAERNVSFSSDGLASPAKGNSENYREVVGTCSMVSEESGPSAGNQNQINDALEELAITDNSEADELTEAKVTKNIQKGFEGNLLLNSSGGPSVSGKTCILAGTEDEAGSIAIDFEKAISPTPDEFTVESKMNEKDKEMIRGEATPSPEETLNASSETRKECLNIDESGALTERQVRREPSLIYRTQVKPTRHDMKENAPNSKIVHILNVTAPRTSKRQPLQDLRKN